MKKTAAVSVFLLLTVCFNVYAFNYKSVNSVWDIPAPDFVKSGPEERDDYIVAETRDLDQIEKISLSYTAGSPQKVIDFYKKLFAGFKEGDIPILGNYLNGEEEGAYFLQRFGLKDWEASPGLYSLSDFFRVGDELSHSFEEEKDAKEKSDYSEIEKCVEKIYPAGSPPTSAAFVWVTKLPDGFREFKVSVDGSLDYKGGCSMNSYITIQELRYQIKDWEPQSIMKGDMKKAEKEIQATIAKMKDADSFYGVTRYPGASLNEDESVRKSVSRGWAPIYALVYVLETDDSPADVEKFYMSKPYVTTKKSPNGFIFTHIENTLNISLDIAPGKAPGNPTDKTRIYIYEFLG